MADEAETKDVLLDSKEAIKRNMTPFGRKLGVVMDDPGGYPYYRIKYMDDKQGGSLPDELSGRWTSLFMCTNDLRGYLMRLWSFSDLQKAQRAKPLASTNASKTERSDSKS